MSGYNKAVFGIFQTRFDTEQCVTALTSAGFRSKDVSVLMSSPDTADTLATEKNTKAPEGTAAGATAGGVIGGALGLLVGLGALAIPGLGPFIAAGPIMGALSGVGAGAVTGGIVGALIGMGLPEYEAKRYEGHLRVGGILISVHCKDSDELKRAKETLKQCDAEDISSEHEVPLQKAS